MKSSVKKILAVVLTGAIVFALASCSVTEKVQSYFVEETSTTVPYTNKSEKPMKTNEIVDYFNRISADLKKAEPYNVTLSRDFSANDFESENSHLKAAFPTVADFIIEYADEKFFERELSGTPVEVYPLEASAVSSIVDFKQVELATCSQTDDYFVITIDFKDDATPLEADGLSKVFNTNDKEAILEEIAKASDLMKVNDYDVEYNGGRIVCKVERGTDNIVSATYSRVIKVTADVTGQGEFASVKNEKVTFNLTENENYTVNWTNPEEATVAED